MSLVARMFGRLSKELEKGIIPAMKLCESLDLNSLRKEADDFSPFISELIKYQRTSSMVHKLICLKESSLNQPTKLKDSSLPDLKLFLKQALIARDMKGLDAAIHLYWQALPYDEIPFKSITNTLLSTKPIGEEENKVIWKRLASEMTFYALPLNLSKTSLENFLKFYGEYPENYLPLVKLAYFYYKHDERPELTSQAILELGDKAEELVDSSSASSDESDESESSDDDQAFLSKLPPEEQARLDEEAEFICKDLNVPVHEPDERPAEREEPSEGNEENEEPDEPKFLEYYTKLLGKEKIDRLMFSINEEYGSQVKEPDTQEDDELELNNLMNSYQKKFEEINSKYAPPANDVVDHDLIEHAFKHVRPREQDFDHAANWMECQLRKGLNLDLPDFIIESFVLNAIEYKKDEFLCQLYNEYPRYSSAPIDPLLVAQIIRIISESDAEGSYIEAVTKIVAKFEFHHPDGGGLGFGVFNLPDVPESIIRCYIKDGKLKEASLFFYEMNYFDNYIPGSMVETLADELYKAKDFQNLLMIATCYEENTLSRKVDQYLKELEVELEKQGIVFEHFYLPEKYYKSSDPFIVKYLGFHGHYVGDDIEETDNIAEDEPASQNSAEPAINPEA